MALTTRQRNKLPASAFLDPKNRRFPVPTAAQASAAGISEPQRLRTLRNARSRSAQRQARGVKHVTPAMTKRAVRKRGGGKIASVLPAKSRSRSSGSSRRSGGTRRRSSRGRRRH
jgi:hypothetical protein